MAHRLDPLLRPRSIAVLGATEREGSVGRRVVHNLQAGGFEGRLYAINPGRDEVLGVACFPDLAALPGAVDHVVFCIGDHRVEAAAAAAIDHGAAAMTLMSQLVLADDPGLSSRVESRLREAGVLVCGPNGMGFYNGRDGVWICGFDTRENHARGGNVTLISHSGAGMSGIVDCEERIDFNLAVSTGQEFSVGLPDYMDFAIEAHDTRVIGLFLETARDPAALVAALEKANARGIPVVALKVGRTELSARLAQSHSGAMAGADSAWEALFDRHGVHRVADMDEFTTALILFAQPHTVADGGLATIHDSGGERQLLVDLADELGTPLADIGADTVAELQDMLDPGLPAVNPLDAWGAGGPDSDRIMERALAALMRDPATAIGAVVHDRGPHGAIYPAYLDYMRVAHRESGKPVFLVANRQGSGTDPQVLEATREGFPVIDGLRPALVGVNALLAQRDFGERSEEHPAGVSDGDITEALALLGAGEVASSRFLAALGLPMNPFETASTADGAVAAAERLDFPVALKTARADVGHKTERGGVLLDLRDAADVRAAWTELSARLGPDVIVTAMARDGLEMALGMVHDPQFGPLIMMGFGGVRLETMNDVVFALPPFGPETARRRLRRLNQRALFRFDRGDGAPDMEAFYRLAAHFSAVVASCAHAVEEIDINPVIVHAHGCVAVDALVVPADHQANTLNSRRAS